MKPSLQLRLSQQLTMTPQLQQAIRLLQLPIMDLQAQIQEALDENVMLEVDEEASVEAAENATSEGEDSATELDLSDADWTDTQRTGPSDTPSSFEPRSEREYADVSEDTLRDHLLWQLELENLDARTTAIGQAIVDGINEDGYLTDESAAILATLSPDIITTEEEIEAVLGLVQRLDPAGVGARSVGECVLLQLMQLDPETPGLALAKTVAGDHLELVAEHQFTALRRQLETTDEALNDALILVRACHPRPGSSITSTAAEYVVPDVYVRRSDGAWVVELNTAAAPQLKVNQSYAGSLGRDGEYDVLRTQLQEARWLIRSLEIRNETLLKVATTIVERQVEFLEHGEEHMRPMILKDIAEAIEMHESTVSRVTTNKYMHTPRGIFELRYFFSSHLSSEDGEQSSTAVRAKIRKMIGGEKPEKPLSDNQITKLLSDEGIRVARRTVAKYREGMKIPSSSERKRSKMAG
ncbi:MAG: RNA polymerase factor sigma-54 [Gammaproteobacteria bacterium]